MTPLQRSIDNYTTGREECEATHEDLACSYFESGWHSGHQDGIYLGRFQGAVIVGVLLAVSWWWGKR